ncbi:Octamer-binding transcription factor [Parasponia andersonii]|uniref:Octamer-binding transcription factor n=1 Tax=Parasponia andersonii TaxID=3476 RepID=A0A2P5DC35_PARAD|nr:Octamer-binding transcription factor [Parasponia andersonii]
MHGCSSGYALPVNAEVDSMGGVVDGGVGIGLKTSPRRAAIEKAQAELSEAKGSFALTASPHGDSVDSSGRPGVPTVCEPNTADNLLLFDGDHDLPEGERNSLRPSRRSNIAPSEQSSQIDGTHNAKESEDSAIVRPYARRNRSRSNREGARSSAIDMTPNRSGQGSVLPVRGCVKDAKGKICETNNRKDQSTPSLSSLKSASSNGDITPKVVASNKQLDTKLDGDRVLEIKTGLIKASLHESKSDVTIPKISHENQHDQPSPANGQQTPADMVSRESDLAGMEQLVSAGLECRPSVGTIDTEKETTSIQMNGFSDVRRDNKSIPNEEQNSNAAVGTKGLYSLSTQTQTSLGIDVHRGSDMCTTTRSVDSNGKSMGKTSDVEGTTSPASAEIVKDKNGTEAVNDAAVINDVHSSVCQKNSDSVDTVKVDKDMHENSAALHDEVKVSDTEEVKHSNVLLSETDGKVDDTSDNSSFKKETSTVRCEDPIGNFMHKPPETASTEMDSTVAPDPHTTSVNSLKVANRAHEDSILEEARIIEAKHKRIAELSVRSMPLENRRKSHWDFVLEEMAWLANDFVQERLWKITAAAQICHRVAFTSRLRFEEQHQRWRLKEVAHALAKAVMQFWDSAGVILKCNNTNIFSDKCEHKGAKEVSKEKSEETDILLEQKKGMIQYPRKDVAHSVQGYAVRFLKYNSTCGLPLKAEAPATPDRISDLGIQDMSWEDHLTEESLFYTVPSGAMEVYRKSIEAHLVQYEKTGSSMQEEVETSMYDAVADYGFQENAYTEDEGETSTYYFPGAFDGSRSSKATQKKRKNLVSYTRSYEPGADLPYGQCTPATQQSMLMGKRPASLNVGPIPTKRMRTASRQRVISPFSAALTANVQVQIKTDASSGDTNSFQDDQTSLLGGSQFQKSMEVESVGDFDKQLPYDCAETSIKPKKKKKAKNLVSTYDQGWQLDSNMLNEQRDPSKKRLGSNHFESNGTSDLYVQHNAKKPKLSKHSLENTFDNVTTMAGSVPSPVASMSNSSKFIKLMGGRDRGRKAKLLKMSAGPPGSGSPWSLFEDQALVVLVHDMGPNWELISDAINSTLHFKCVFRKPNECKERHKILMDKGSGDGADSAEDSGSSQPYPSTLPGIPKARFETLHYLGHGSARQLFQRLKEPMEDETLKSHFEKIIKIGQKQHYYRRTQSENQDLKQIAPVHNSHVIALSQVCPNNLNGGVLTPLDLCDTTSSNQDVLALGCQGPHASGLAISNQGAAASLLPSTGKNSSLQGSSGVVLGTNLSSPSGALNATVRDGRYSMPRTSSLPVEEQQRMQKYNQVLSSRNIQQSSLPVPGSLSGSDRGVRMLPGGNGMGMMCGMNRSMPISRPGYQGMTSPSLLNSGSMLSSSMVGMPSPVNMHSGASSAQGNSMSRPREALQMMRPGHNAEHQRQIVVPELQMQVTQGNAQGITAFNGLNASFSSQTTPPTGPSYPGHPQQQHQISPQQSHGLGSPHHPHLQGPNHATGPQQQAFAIRLAKERQMQQQRYLQQQQQQQQQQFAASNALMSHVQSQTHLPVSSALQNSSQIQSQTPSQPVSLSPLTPSSPMTPIAGQHQQKHHLPPHGLSRNPGASGLTNQMGKQRQRQQQHLQQTGRHHPQQRQHVQSQQQAKLLKGVGRGLVQNLSVDPSHLNGLSVPPGSQSVEKGEQIMQLIQGQGVYSGSGLNTMPPPKTMVPQSSNHLQLQQKLLASSAPTSTKQLQQMPSHSDSGTQGQVPPVSSGHTLSSSHQVVPAAVMASNHQQAQGQPHQKQVNQSNVQRMIQQNRQVNSELPIKSQNDLAQADQQPVNTTSQVVASMATPQSCTDSTVAVPVSSAIAPQWKSSEPIFDSNIPNSTIPSVSVGSPSISHSSGNEPTPPISQGLGPRQLSGSLPSHGQNVGTHWQQPPPSQPLQQSPTLPPTSQQYMQQEQQRQQPEQKSPQNQLPLQQQPQQQIQHLQAGQGSLYLRPANSKPE